MKTSSLLKIFESGSVLTNLFLFSYLFFFHELVYDYFFYDIVRDVSRAAIFENRENPVLGLLLFGIIVAEFVAYVWKSKSARVSEDGFGGIFLIWIFHTVIAVLMSITAMTMLGYSMDDVSCQMVLVLFLTVIKELAILGVVAVKSDKKNDEKISRWKSIGADVIFAVFYSLAYTIVIGNILAPSNYENYLFAAWYAKPLMIMNTLIIILLFFMFYMPMRMAYFIFEKPRSGTERAVSWAAVILVAAAVVILHFEGEVSLEEALERPESVKILFLNSRGLERLDPRIGELKNLRALHLGYNKLKKLPREVSKLQKLQWIGLAGNRLKEVPPILLKLESLKELNIRYNRIGIFPADLSGFKNLTYLNAGLNGLDRMEKSRIRNELSGVKLVLE